VRLAIALAIMTIASSVTSGQQRVSPPPSFEVASVRLNKSGDPGGSLRRQPGGRIDAVNMPLNTLITFAYQVPLFLLTGGPAWIADERFDIVARLERDEAETDPAASPDSLRMAMRTLLADRFKLRVHSEAREGDIYALVMARPGTNPSPGLNPRRRIARRRDFRNAEPRLRRRPIQCNLSSAECKWRPVRSGSADYRFHNSQTVSPVWSGRSSWIEPA
jgi:uncharacterized protein (TIGR03435 family)